MNGFNSIISISNPLALSSVEGLPTVFQQIVRFSRITMMRKQKQKRLQAKGWKVGTVKQFLGLSNEEAAYIELKIKLAAGLRQRRQQKGLSQLDLAAKLQSSQSRVAKMEAGDPSVSLDLLIRSLISLGTTERELSRLITTQRAA